MIGRNGERGSGISALAARHDDDEFSWSLNLYTNILYIVVIYMALLFCMARSFVVDIILFAGLISDTIHFI